MWHRVRNKRLSGHPGAFVHCCGGLSRLRLSRKERKRKRCEITCIAQALQPHTEPSNIIQIPCTKSTRYLNFTQLQKTIIATTDPRAQAAERAISTGDIASLNALFKTYPELPACYVGNTTEARSLLHILTDWPGKHPNSCETAKILITARYILRHLCTGLQVTTTSL